jgi:uncharacterized protein
MDSPRSGSLNQTVELVRIETDLFDLYIKGKPFHPTVEALQLHREDDNERVTATLEIVPSNGRIQVQSKQVFSPAKCELIDHGVEPALPCFFETQPYQVIIQKKKDLPLEFYHENLYLRRAVQPIGGKSDTLAGVLNFQNEVGYTDFEIRVAGEKVLLVRIEIFPVKIDYRTDYQNILQEVNEQLYNLAFDFMRKTYSMAGKKQTSQQSLAEFYRLLEPNFEQLIKAVSRIEAAPYHRLKIENRVVVADKVKRPGKENIAYLSKRPHLLVESPDHGMLQIQGQRYQPTKLIETRRRHDYDTPENRFVKWALRKIGTKLKELRNALKQQKSNQRGGANTQISDWLKPVEDMQTQVSRLLRSDFLQEVGEMRQMSVTLVLQMAPNYREVYRLYLLLMKGLTLQSDLLEFRLSLKDVAQLYEYWCFLKIHDLLKKKYDLVSQDVLRVNQSGLFATIDKNRKSRVTYQNPQNGEKFTLYYNSMPPMGRRNGDKVPTLEQKPDNVLSLNKHESKVPYSYVFDAKYRLNPAYPGTYYGDSYRTPGPEVEDINTMHRYRDAIVYQDAARNQYERSMFGAYVLFPYHDQDEFEEHHFYKSIKKVNVGALPFLPNSTRLMEEFLDELIMESPENAFERALPQRGTEKYFTDKLGGKNVLIGNVFSKEQFDACRQHNMYYMPLTQLGKDQKSLTQLQVIGLYQSRALFGQRGCGIRWIGKVSSWNVVARHEITELPISEGEEDVPIIRFEIESWEKRKSPIEPGGRGISTYLLTCQYMLERATVVQELRIESEEQLRDWREKRRRGKVKVELDREGVGQEAEVVSIEVE